MKRTLIASALLASSLAITPVLADTPHTHQKPAPATQAKQVGAFGTVAIIGAATGGPVGLAVAGLSGMWIADRIGHADAAKAKAHAERLAMAQTIHDLKAQLATSEQAAEHAARFALAQLQLELLFKTNDSGLTPQGEQRVAALADFLKQYPALRIRLDGHTDPRGSRAENQLLSDARVKAVHDALVAQGIDENRLSSFSHGERDSVAARGDNDAYAMERVVQIRLERADGSTVAQASLQP